MMNKRNIIQIGILFVLILTGVVWSVIAQERMIYEEQTGEAVVRYEYQVSGTETVEIQVNEIHLTSRNICDQSGISLVWKVKGDNVEIRVTRDGAHLYVTGWLKNDKISRQETIDKDPWYQALSYSLGEWLSKGEKSVTFWTVRPDDFSVHKMKARKAGIETIELNGVLVQAIRVNLSLDNALSFFWSVNYWFREDDHVFVKYEGTHGPPGTEKTVVQLVATTGK